MALPPFDQGGVLPPFLGALPGDSADQTPYHTTIVGLVERFCTNRERALLLKGLLRFRAELVGFGFSDGFQWIDGSFVERSETTKGRPPGDIDVVTVARRPRLLKAETEWEKAATPLLSTLFSSEHCKATFSCDAYYIDLDVDPESVAEQVAFWFSLFSHQRNTFRWKGIVQVSLHGDDRGAEEEIARRMAQWPVN
jgi:hypothetical protein